MATAAMGLWNHHAAASQSAKTTSPMAAASPTNGASAAGSDSAAISANDFLTLLVTEMKNQDPTANTDPNQYINQLVQVNSLEQLISINQTLSSDPAVSAKPSAHNVGGSDAIASTHVTKSETASAAASLEANAGIRETHQSLAHRAAGNLSIPEPNQSAQRVARSLGGRTAAL